MAYVNLYNLGTSGYVRRLVKINAYTFVLGFNGIGLPYLAKLDGNGNLIWQKRYDFSGSVNGGSVWSKCHFTDIVEITENEELLLLVSDQNNFLIVKLNVEGDVIWVKKYYDKSDTPMAYNGLSVTARLFKLNENNLVLKIDDIHSQNGGVRRIDHRFYQIEPERGSVKTSKRIISQNPLLLIREEEVRREELVLFGYTNGEAVVLTLDISLNIVQSSALYYNGNLRGFNYLHIYAVSPVFNGKYSVIGSFYHYDPLAESEEDKLEFILNLEGEEDEKKDPIPYAVLESLVDFSEPLPSRFTRFFTAEISEDHKIVSNERLLEKDFTATYQTIHQNSIGIFFSISHRLYKCNGNLTATDWLKNIRVSEWASSNYLVVNKSIGNSFDAYSYSGVRQQIAIASTDLDYESCKTELIKESIRLSEQRFSIRGIDIPMEEFPSKEYENPQVNIINIENSLEELCPSDVPQPDLAKSTITAQPTSIIANGITTATITVTLKDSSGNIIVSSNFTVYINTSAGTWQGAVTTTGDGIYRRVLISSTQVETATLNFSVDGIGLSPNTATVNFTLSKEIIDISEITAIQSPHLYLQASGSIGKDSTRGKHLRWAFRGTLGEKHLPKGDYAVNNINFNKPNDYVRVYKGAYKKKLLRLNLITDIPQVIDNNNHTWIYRISGKEFYVRFRNTSKYNQVLQTINPLQNPSQFILNYGSELMEIENTKELFYAVTCNFPQSSFGSREFKVETLSVSTNTPVANRFVTNRKSIINNELGTPLKLLCENGRSVRWKIFNSRLNSLDFEFYSDTIDEVNNTSGWNILGDFALTLENEKAFKQLEPKPGDVNGVWHRFNEEALVNIENYHHKWDGVSDPGDRNIKEVVSKYIELSENVNNPLAIENISLENDPSDPEDYMQISNLDMLNFSANDYHIARMLGLGILDKPGGLSEQRGDNIYVAEYYTFADLEDGEGKRKVQHLFMSLPTTEADSRLPNPVDLNEIVPGIFLDEENGDSSSLTDEDGYSHDGMSRYVSLYSEALPEDDVNTPFFISEEEINLGLITAPVYGGLKYRLNQGDWQKPELSKDPRYYNIVPHGDPFYETRFILIPEPLHPFYTHRQTANGVHRYKSYGINWFSRVKVGDAELSIETLLKQKNPLLAPSNVNALLIRKESPLFLTSAEEQDRLTDISSNDKTLIRLTYNYHSFHELKNYNIPIDSTFSNQQLVDEVNNPQVLFPDLEEIFADEVDIFFRNQVPNNIRGKALTVSNHASNEVLSIITTGNYEIVSTGETLIPHIAPGTETNYVGGIFISGDNQYIIHQITHAPQGLVFTVYKKEISDSIVNGGGVPSSPPIGELEAPILVADGLFMVVENMLNTSSWGTPNPLNFKIKVGANWEIHREVIEHVNDEGDVERKVEKSRGIWGAASVNVYAIANEPGIYKIEFDNNTPLAQHSQYNSGSISAEWYKGIVRIFTQSAGAGSVPNNTRKVLPVLGIENIGGTNLSLIVQDPSFDPTDPSYDTIETGNNISVNFYPGYKIYLYENSPFGIDEQNILPDEGEGIHYSIFGLRSHDSNGGCDPVSGSCFSKIGIPCLMFAQELVEAFPPQQPKGAKYATRPDFFGRSTYTLTTKYEHKPHGVLFYRSNDEALLNALYEKNTIKDIRENLEVLGGNNEEFLTDRWENFLRVDELATDGDFKVFPPINVSPEGYKFPNPDKQAFFDWANHILSELEEPIITDTPGSLPVGSPKILQFVKGAIYNAFVSLTEVPILYQYLNGKDYQLMDKPQVIKDRNGHILKPGSEDFEMAPMMKLTEEPDYETLFTDFKLDGTSNNLYFYGVKELSTQMNMSDFSLFLGPIKLVNTNAPETPEIKRIIPVLENPVLGISPMIQLEINAFSKVQNIKKISIYRADTFLDAQSVQTMQLVKIVDLEDENILDEPIWTVTDNFEDLIEIPYGDGLFYKVTASREVRYADANGITIVEYAPSQASKIVASLMMEANAPLSPVLKFLSTAEDSNNEIHSVSLKWSKSAYKAKYHLYKMNSQGNWTEIHQLQTNEDDIVLALVDTDLQSGTLALTDDDGNTMYHHFKVIAENTAGMLSTDENILTIFNEDDWIII